MSRPLFLVLALVLSLNANAFNQGFMFHQASLKAKYSGGPKSAPTFFNQKLDHNDASRGTFRQRYFVDSTYAVTPSTAPVFYIICGEWNCAGANSYSAITRLAKETGAHLVALEHRFYGESMPTKILKPKALETLTLDMAIEDLANFQRYAMDTLNLKGKWVAFGGSYAGTLSAFYRLKHPELVVGALSSSGPVFAKAAFNEYDAHVAQVINRTSCGEKVRAAVAQIETRMDSPEGVREVKELFNATAIRDNEDFLYIVADVLAAAVQYGMHTSFCATLESSSDLVLGYAKAGNAILSAMGTTAVEISMQAAEEINATADSYFRQWMWQSCQEFGWFQVANGTGNGTSRSSRIDLDYHSRVCSRLFSKPMEADGALNTNWYLPLFDPATTKIIFTNGSNDPWQRLSIVPNQTPNNVGLTTMMMDGAAHCNDLNANNTLPSVMAAQAQFGSQIKTWLAQ